MRAWLTISVALLGPTTGLLDAAVARAEATCTDAYVDWRFRASSPISSPIAADAEGRVFVATHEGYVHGIGPDGRFLWGYTVSGGLVFGVTTDESGRLYTTSTDGKVWALSPDGTARWVFQTPMRAESPLVVGPKHAATFVSGEVLQAVSSRAGLLWGVPLGGAANGAPLLGPQGETWLGTSNGWLHAIETPFRRKRWRVSQSSIELLAVTRRVALVATESQLEVFDREGVARWSLHGVRRAAVDVRGAERGILVRSDVLAFVDTETGQTLATVPYSERVSATPLLVGERAYVPREDGRLDLVDSGGVRESCHLGEAALFAPVLAGSRIAVADASGAVTALAVPGEQR
jgi:hypothetical protein